MVRPKTQENMWMHQETGLAKLGIHNGAPTLKDSVQELGAGTSYKGGHLEHCPGMQGWR